MQLAKENNIPFAVALNVIASALKSKGLTFPLAFVAKLFRIASELVLSSSLSMVSVTIEVIPYFPHCSMYAPSLSICCDKMSMEVKIEFTSRF